MCSRLLGFSLIIIYKICTPHYLTRKFEYASNLNSLIQPHSYITQVDLAKIFTFDDEDGEEITEEVSQ